MRPELFALDLPFKTIPIYAYGFMVMAGFIAAIHLCVRRARTVGIDPNLIVDLGLWIMISGIAGARILYITQFRQDFDWTLTRLFGEGLRWWPTVLGALAGIAWFVWRRRRRSRGSPPAGAGKLDPLFAVGFVLLGAWLGHVAGNWSALDLGIFRIDRGGLVFYGGLVGASCVGALFLWARKANIWAVADCVAPSLAVGLAFGRIGCFLNGCCWGKRCDLPWAVEFPARYEGTSEIPNPVFTSHLAHGWVESDAPMSLSVHPTQLYASAGALVLFFVLSWFFARRRVNGEVFALFGLLYGIDRFVVETFRADNDAVFAGMTISQNISIAVFLVGGLLFFYHRRRGRAAPPTGPIGAASRPAKSL